MKALEATILAPLRHVRKSRTAGFLWWAVLVCLFGGIALVTAARMRPVGEGATPVQKMSPIPRPAETGDPNNAIAEPVHGDKSPDNRARIVLIIDDLGYSMAAATELAELKIPLTWSIIPYQSQSLSCLKLAKEKGIPAMLHLPMEAEVDRPGQKYQVNLEMDEDAIRGFTRRALQSLPGVVGLNNHRGSRATASARVMTSVLEEVKAKGLIFVDSRTSGKSVAYKIAMEKGIPTLKNEVFLDHEADPAAMMKALEKAFARARKNGSVVMIANARPQTLEFLKTLHLSQHKDVKWMTVPEFIGLSTGSGQGGVSP